MEISKKRIILKSEKDVDSFINFTNSLIQNILKRNINSLETKRLLEEAFKLRTTFKLKKIYPIALVRTKYRPNSLSIVFPKIEIIKREFEKMFSKSMIQSLLGEKSSLPSKIGLLLTDAHIADSKYAVFNISLYTLKPILMIFPLSKIVTFSLYICKEHMTYNLSIRVYDDALRIIGKFDINSILSHLKTKRDWADFLGSSLDGDGNFRDHAIYLSVNTLSRKGKLIFKILKEGERRGYWKLGSYYCNKLLLSIKSLVESGILEMLTLYHPLRARKLEELKRKYIRKEVSYTVRDLIENMKITKYDEVVRKKVRIRWTSKMYYNDAKRLLLSIGIPVSRIHYYKTETCVLISRRRLIWLKKLLNEAIIHNVSSEKVQEIEDAISFLLNK